MKEATVAVRERPILFSGAMVRAILDGTKTQTRRVVKPQPTKGPDGEIAFPWASFFRNGVVCTWCRQGIGGENWDASEHPSENRYREALRRTPYEDPCRYGVPGDRLWVRETWAQRAGTRTVAYRADGECGAWTGDGGGGRLWLRHGGIGGSSWSRPDSWRGQTFGLNYFGGRWRPSIHMPRWASRLTLEIVDVRVEQIQAISETDARAEGVERHDDDGATYYGPYGKGHASAVVEFRRLWDSLNAARGHGWGANPWVWVIDFRAVAA